MGQCVCGLFGLWGQSPSSLDGFLMVWIQLKPLFRSLVTLHLYLTCRTVLFHLFIVVLAMRTLSNLKVLTILVWNVRGLTIEKLKDNKFKQILNKDIIFLIETHTNKDSKINLPGYIHSQSTRELKSKDCTKGSEGIVSMSNQNLHKILNS